MLFHLSRKWNKNYIRGDRILVDDPNVFPEGEVSLAHYEDLIKWCENSLKTIDNYVIKNAFVYGMWLSHVSDRFQEEKRMNGVSSSFNDWDYSQCKVKQTQVWQLRKFYKLFFPYKVLRCKLPFLWFVKNGDIVVKYFESQRQHCHGHMKDCACCTWMKADTAVSWHHNSTVYNFYLTGAATRRVSKTLLLCSSNLYFYVEYENHSGNLWRRRYFLEEPLLNSHQNIKWEMRCLFFVSMS